jgi:Spy/CpxP family protein refolding chaperone
MFTTILFAALLAAPETTTTTTTPAAKPDNHSWQCSTGRNRLRSQESRETWDQIKALKKDNGGGVPPEAQKILNQMTEMFEQDDSRSSSDMAEMMREFAGGKAERRTAC